MGIIVFFALAMPLEPEAPAATLELNALTGTRVVVAAAVGCAMAFLIYFNDLAEATSAADGRFRLDFPHEGPTFVASIFFFPTAFGHLLEFFPTASSFLFLTASVNSSVPSTGQGLEVTPTSSKNAVQSTSVVHVSKASIMLWLSVATNNTFCIKFNPHQKPNIILIIILVNSYEFRQWHLQFRDRRHAHGHSVEAGTGS
jgi:hypothetical protein